MAVDPAAAAGRRSTAAGTAWFCSAHCAAAFDTDPGRYTPAHAAHGTP
ncbi:MAG: hypothetical protein M3Y33_17695 [Actinomycetota bacterium]|nr:hypothetical protein [Actinomycetota bacterium]